MVHVGFIGWWRHSKGQKLTFHLHKYYIDGWQNSLRGSVLRQKTFIPITAAVECDVLLAGNVYIQGCTICTKRGMSGWLYMFISWLLKANKASKQPTTVRVTPLDIFKDPCRHFQLLWRPKNWLFFAGRCRISKRDRGIFSQTTMFSETLTKVVFVPKLEHNDSVTRCTNVLCWHLFWQLCYHKLLSKSQKEP